MASKKLNIGVHIGCLYSDIYYWTHVDIKLSDRDLHSSSQMGESKNFCAKDLTKCLSIWMEFCKLLRLAGLMIFMLIFFCLMNVKARESYLHDFVNNNKKEKEKTFTLACVKPFTDQVVSEFIMIMIIDRYILKLVWMTLTFIQGHSYKRSYKLPYLFSHKDLNQFGWNVVSFHVLFVEVHAKFIVHN